MVSDHLSDNLASFVPGLIEVFLPTGAAANVYTVPLLIVAIRPQASSAASEVQLGTCQVRYPGTRHLWSASFSVSAVFFRHSMIYSMIIVGAIDPLDSTL